jgi:hypothetical protein
MLYRLLAFSRFTFNKTTKCKVSSTAEMMEKTNYKKITA